MKIYAIFLIGFIIHAVLSAKGKRPTPKYPKRQLGTTSRPRGFKSEVTQLLSEMATDNNYIVYDKCHIVPWKFMKDMVVSHWAHGQTKAEMRAFIKKLGIIHKSAAYYKALKDDTQKELSKLALTYTTRALSALREEDSYELLKCLFNMPSNLYPGNPSNNRSIKDNLDPPKEASKLNMRRTRQASEQAKKLFKAYEVHGLTTKPAPYGTRIKSADKPPGDTTGDYVTIT